jgi:hypothetical protein
MFEYPSIMLKFNFSLKKYKSDFLNRLLTHSIKFQAFSSLNKPNQFI